ncbi:probable complex I intermediate-associated protein 30 isoform X3 [Capsicum annuum]|uniref:probable complex I intermediate-associated protein 30 isoform X3 n=1 Tax=Capsicum annuum TaxID=4072 RepID=UPI001FB13F86|nr:probable complex I intermediate-associated protein 30 isoform X3 [Capsicum annuum]
MEFSIQCCRSFFLLEGKFDMSRFRSLLQASLNATRKVLAGNIEDLIPPSERYIFNFSSKDELKNWHLYSDSEYGGLSSAALEIKDTGNGSTSVGVFSGNLSLDVIEGSKWNMTRSGFCGMRSKKFDGFIDLDGYDTIALKLKGDGRCYISTFNCRYTQRIGSIVQDKMKIIHGRHLFLCQKIITGISQRSLLLVMHLHGEGT